MGEVVALRRMDLDVNAGTVTVRQAQVELDTGELIIGPPKSRAGLRTVALPPGDHPEPAAATRRPHRPGARSADLLWQARRRPAAGRLPAGVQVGETVPRWACLTCTSMTSGTTLPDLMERMGHDSVRAALIYQHRTAGGNRAIARAMDDKINNVDPDDDDGAAGSLAIVG